MLPWVRIPLSPPRVRYIMSSLELVGDLILCVSIIASIIIFAKINCDYLPENSEYLKEKRDGQNSSTNDSSL